MLGEPRRAAVGGTALLLLAAALWLSPVAPARASGPCVVNDVISVAMDHQHGPSLGTWTDVKTGEQRPWYGMSLTEPDSFQWRVNATCGGGGVIVAAGTGSGMCGYSTAQGWGSRISWVSAGLTFVVSGGPSGVLLAQYDVGGCNANVETKINVTGVLA
jgi:hypothetical protein